MLVYVVLVTSSSSARRPTTRSSSSPRSCPGSGSRARSTDAIDVGRRPGPADQADPVPEDRPAGRGDVAGIVSFAFGTDRRSALADAVLSATGSRRTWCSSRSSRPSSSCSRWRCASWSPPATSSSATSATSPATSCACGSSCRRASTAWRSLDAQRDLQGAPDAARRSSALNPFAILFDGLPHGHLRHRRPAGAARRRPTGRARPSCSSASLVLLALTTLRLQAPRADLRQGPLMPSRRRPPRPDLAAPTTRSTPRDLGVHYDLRFTKKTTLRESLGQTARARRRPTGVLGAPPRRPSGSCTASRWRSSARTAPARARSSRSWPGSSRRPRASVDVRGHVSAC